MKLLPILWGTPPQKADWDALSAARTRLGHQDLIMPARAVLGSPGRILAIGARPDWLCPHRYVNSTSDTALTYALGWCLEEDPVDMGEEYAEQLSEWFGAEVKYIGEESTNDEA